MAKMSQNPYPFLTMIIMDLAGLSHVNLIRLSYKIILCHLKILFLKWAGVGGGGRGGGLGGSGIFRNCWVNQNEGCF